MQFRVIFLCMLMIVSLSAIDNPETVYRIVYVQKPNEWYKQQAVLWNKVLAVEPGNEDAWMNFYMANRYAHTVHSERKNILDSIMAEIEKNIPDTYTYYYLRSYHGPKTKISFSELEQAHQRWPQKSGILYELFDSAILSQKEKKIREYAKKLYQSEDIVRGLLEYNANVLSSTKPDAILLTNGDNDTYPAWVLQYAQGYRPDVAIINVHLAFAHRDYLDKLLMDYQIKADVSSLSTKKLQQFVEQLVVNLDKNNPKRPLYLAATLNNSFVNPLKKDLYLVGLVYRFNQQRMENLEVLKTNLEQNLRLDYLRHDWYAEFDIANQIVQKLNVNYIPLFMHLADYMFKSGQKAEAKYWKNRALTLAEHLNNKKLINKVQQIQF